MMSMYDYIRKVLGEPEMTDEDASFIMSGGTGWPCFWSGKHAWNPMKCFTYQLRHSWRSLKRGFTIDQIYEGVDMCPQSGKKLEKTCRY